MLILYLIATMVYALLANPVWVSAQNTSSETSSPPPPLAAPKAETIPKGEASQGTQNAELVIVGKKEGKEPTDFRFKMGEDLQIKATGEYASKVRTELAKATRAKALALYLDDVRMANLTVSALQVEPGKELRLYFHLARNSQDDDNRKAWDMLLKKQDSYIMTLPVALAVGSELPMAVQSPRTFEFYITTGDFLALISAIGLVIFLGAYWGLIKNPTALRDMKGGFYSLGKSQMAFWGLLVVLTFVGVWVVTGTMERIPSQVLILLGISGATGLSAVVIGENKKASKDSEIQNSLTKLREEQQTLQKEQLLNSTTFPQASKDRLVSIKSEIEVLSQQPASHQSPKFWQDICNDGDGMSFHRLQVVIWTMVLGMIFVWSVAQVISMPEFSETLLILLGISNGTYLGFKIPEKS
jgi:hypothetical protein